MYFDQFKSSHPFLSISWSLDYFDAVFGTTPPSGVANHAWVVFFDPEKLKQANLNDFNRFHSFVGSIMDELKVEFEFKSAPLTDIETNQIWLSAPCGYEQLWIDQASTEPNFCINRFHQRLTASENGKEFTIYESLVNISRAVDGSVKTPRSNKALGEAIVERFNQETGIPNLATLSHDGYCSEPSYDGYY